MHDQYAGFGLITERMSANRYRSLGALGLIVQIPRGFGGLRNDRYFRVRRIARRLNVRPPTRCQASIAPSMHEPAKSRICNVIFVLRNCKPPLYAFGVPPLVIELDTAADAAAGSFSARCRSPSRCHCQAGSAASSAWSDQYPFRAGWCPQWFALPRRRRVWRYSGRPQCWRRSFRAQRRYWSCLRRRSACPAPSFSAV